MKNYYKILGVSEHATAREIKRAYHAQVKKYHPDNGENDYWKQMVVELNEAYKVLMDEQLRQRYDAELKLYKMTHIESKTDLIVTERKAPWETVEKENTEKETADNTGERTADNFEKIHTQKEKIKLPVVTKILVVVMILFAVLTLTTVIKDNFIQVRVMIAKAIDPTRQKRSTVDGTLNLYFDAIRDKNTKEANRYCSDDFEDFNGDLITQLKSLNANEEYKEVTDELTQFTCHYVSALYNEERTRAVVTVECNNLNAAKWLKNKTSTEEMSAYKMKEDAYRMKTQIELTLLKTKKGWEIRNISSKEKLAKVLTGRMMEL